MYYIPTAPLGLGKIDKCMVPLHLRITYKYTDVLCLTFWQLPLSEHGQIAVAY